MITSQLLQFPTTFRIECLCGVLASVGPYDKGGLLNDFFDNELDRKWRVDERSTLCRVQTFVWSIMEYGATFFTSRGGGYYTSCTAQYSRRGGDWSWGRGCGKMRIVIVH